MSFKLHKILVSKVSKETSDAVSVQFKIPDNLKSIFRYKQGQYLSMQFNVNGETYRREYSLCSSPFYNEPLAIALKKVKGGKVSNYICDNLKAGDIVESFPPQGKFYSELNKNNEKMYFLVGGGSGITPLMSIIKSVLVAEPKSKAILYYGNQNEYNIIFRKVIDSLSEIYKDNFKAYYTLEEHDRNWEGLSGKINKTSLMEILNVHLYDPGKTEYFLCGPLPMMQLVKETIGSLGVDRNRVHIEYFTPPENKEDEHEPVESGELIERNVKVILGNEEAEIIVPPKSVILNAVIDAGLDPPFSCRSGICTTCRAKLLSGKVKMDEREGLSDAEIEEGFILTCQSHPLTDDVVVKYE